MNRVSNNGNFSLSLVASTTTMDKYGVWDLQTYNGNTYLFHDSSSTMRLWVYYDGGWKVTYVQNSTNPSSTEKPTELYVEDDGKQPQSLAFTPATATYDLYAPTSFIKPTLSTAYGTITYSSSDATIAEVDNSGNITGHKTGDVTITATAAGNTQYKPGSASYTLTVVNSDPSGPTDPVYTKVTSSSGLVAGGKYLLVYEDGSKVFKPSLNGSNFATTGNAIDVTISGGMITSSDLGDCEMTLEDGYYLYVSSVSRYIYPTYNNMGAEETKSSSHSFSISIDNGTATISRTSNNTTYKLRYSSSSSYFQSSTSSANVALYKLDEGSNPGGGDEPDPPTPSTSTYTLISGDANLVTGTYLIVDKTKGYLFNASGSNNGGYSTIGSSGITLSGSTITLTSEIAAASEFVFTRSGDNLTIKQVGGSHSGQYMFASSNTSNTYIGFQSAENNFTINSQTGTDLVYFCTTKGNSNAEYLYKKAADSFFKLGQSGAPGGGDAGV